MRIRNWLKKAESCRRTFVVVVERTAEQIELERRRAADARHGLVTMSGRRTA